MTDSNSPSHEQISRRAYEIFMERGQPAGQDLAHWLEAERQLRSADQAKPAAQVAQSTTRTGQSASQPSQTNATAQPSQTASTPQPSAAALTSGKTNGRSQPRAGARK